MRNRENSLPCLARAETALQDAVCFVHPDDPGALEGNRNDLLGAAPDESMFRLHLYKVGQAGSLTIENQAGCPHQGATQPTRPTYLIFPSRRGNQYHNTSAVGLPLMEADLSCSEAGTK